MEAEAITAIISQIGFPIFVACWLLFKGEQQNKNVVEALNELKNAVTVLAERVVDSGN